MNVKKYSIRLSLVFLITILITATAVTILSVSAGFYRNTINWVLEVLSQKVTDHIVDQVTANIDPKKEFENSQKLLRKIEISPNGKLLLLNLNYTIITSSERKNGKVVPVRFDKGKVNIAHVKDPIIKKSFNKYLKNEKKKKRKFLKRKFDHFPFWHDFNKYLAIYKPFKLSTGELRYIAVIFPYQDYFSSMTRNNIILYSLALLFVLLAIFISMRISKRISQPLTALAEETIKIKNFELDSTIHIESPLDEVENMSKAIDNMRSGLKSFKKYVPSDLVKELIHQHKEATLGGEKKKLTIFFSDIAGFTSISEKLSPEVLVEFLGEYLGEMTEIILKHKGTVDKYIGDCIMAFWGAPIEFDDHAILGCKAALKYQERLGELGAIWKGEGKPDFSSRIGINTGDIIVGNMGYEERMNYTVIGDPVNLASRLEAQNKSYGTSIMIGEETYEDVKGDMETRFLDIVAVKGKVKGVRVYELISEKGKIDDMRAEHRSLYEKGFNQYLKKDFEEAKKTFKQAIDLNNKDKASKVFHNRCISFIKDPPPSNWDGVFIAKTK